MSVSDVMNPVTLKELRQMVRSRLVAAGLIGFLAVALIAVAIVLLSSRSSLQNGIALGAQGLGKEVFQSVYFVLTLLLLFCAPFYVGIRMGAERSGEHLDLQYTTILKPRQFVDGKTAAACILILLFASAALPFLSLSYLLRGLDVFQALLATLMLICVAICCVYEGLFLAAVSTSRVFRVLILLSALGFQSTLVGMVTAGGAAMVSFGRHISFATWSGCVWPALFVAGCASVCLLLRAATTSLIMPPPANRAPPVRFWVTGLWLVWGGIAGVTAWLETELGFVYAWSIVSISVTAVLSGIAASFAPGYSRRVLGEVSSHRLTRIHQFLLFSGAENGMLWALLPGAVSVGVVMLCENSGLSWCKSSADMNARRLAGFLFYLIAYVWSVRAVWQFGFHRWVTYRLAGVVAGVLIILGWALPALAALGDVKAGRDAAWLFGNVFAMFTEEQPEVVPLVLGAGVWAAMAVAANLPGLRAALLRFAPKAAGGDSEKTPPPLTPGA